MSQAQLDAVIARFGAMKAGWGSDVTLGRMRSDLDRVIGSFRPDFEFQATPVNAGGVPAEWVSTPASDPERVMLYLHGGGFATGSIDGTRSLAAHLAQACECRVLVLGYRLAPEHPFPAAVEDALTAYRRLIELGIEPRCLALGGDSAGGGLAVVLMKLAATAGLPPPACAVLLTPWADLRCEGDSYRTNASRDPVANQEMARMMAATYLGSAGRADDPRATPILGKAKGIAPLLIQAAGRDVFLDDARAIDQWAHAGGVSSELDVWPDMIHQWQQYGSALDEAGDAVRRIGAFVRRHCASS